MRLAPLLLAAALAVLTACAAPRPVVATVQPGPILIDQHLPPYVRNQFEPFTRANAIAIAQREWRAWGSLVDDEPPGGSIPKALRPDDQAGLWQRVADYWWMGQDFSAEAGQWSSRYNENGTPYSGSAPAWSAAFISYVMRMSGAGNRFPYTPLHADYINAAARNEGVLHAERPEVYAAVPGDLICLGRGSARNMRYDDLPTSRFFGHCDIVVSALPGQLTVIGGNVAASVTVKHVPTTATRMLATPDGQVVDGRYPWFVVLRVSYDG
jgi:hypothetical protein